MAVIASARQTTEELYLLSKIASRAGAVTDSVPRRGEGDALLLHSDRNPNMAGAKAIGIVGEQPGSRLKEIAAGISSGTIRTLVVFGEDVTRHGISSELLAKLETLIVSDILPNETSRRAHYLLPGCAHAEKRGTFITAKGRIQRFLKAVEAPGDARPEAEFLEEWLALVEGPVGGAAGSVFSMESLFNRMAREVPALAGLEWAKLGELGAPTAL